MLLICPLLAIIPPAVPNPASHVSPWPACPFLLGPFSSPLELSSELLVSDSLLLLEEELLSLLLLGTSSGSLLVTLLCTARLFFFFSVVFPPLASLLLFSLLAFPLLAFFFILCSPVTQIILCIMFSHTSCLLYLL
jgi:hypothetical protein